MQKYLFWPVIIFLAIGWFYPIVGILILFIAPIPPIFALTIGRYWCGNYCPNGSMFDHIGGKISCHRPLPTIFTNMYLRVLILVIFIGVFIWRLTISWGDWPSVGKMLVSMVTAGSATFIIAGAFLHERLWCAVCPVGTMSKLVSPNTKTRTYVSAACTMCKMCNLACPVRLKPYLYKGNPEGITDADCMKCGACMRICPVKAIEIK